MTVNMQLRKIDGTLQQAALGNIVLGPGEGGGFAQAIGSLPNHLWCRFTVVSGSSADIRANLAIIGEATGFSAVIREAR